MKEKHSIGGTDAKIEQPVIGIAQTMGGSLRKVARMPDGEMRFIVDSKQQSPVSRVSTRETMARLNSGELPIAEQVESMQSRQIEPGHALEVDSEFNTGMLYGVDEKIQDLDVLERAIPSERKRLQDKREAIITGLEARDRARDEIKGARMIGRIWEDSGAPSDDVTVMPRVNPEASPQSLESARHSSVMGERLVEELVGPQLKLSHQAKVMSDEQSVVFSKVTGSQEVAVAPEVADEKSESINPYDELLGTKRGGRPLDFIKKRPKTAAIATAALVAIGWLGYSSPWSEDGPAVTAIEACSDGLATPDISLGGELAVITKIHPTDEQIREHLMLDRGVSLYTRAAGDLALSVCGTDQSLARPDKLAKGGVLEIDRGVLAPFVYAEGVSSVRTKSDAEIQWGGDEGREEITFENIAAASHLSEGIKESLRGLASEEFKNKFGTAILQQASLSIIESSVPERLFDGVVKAQISDYYEQKSKDMPEIKLIGGYGNPYVRDYVAPDTVSAAEFDYADPASFIISDDGWQGVTDFVNKIADAEVEEDNKGD